jgi:hypothetical protein
MSAEPSVDASDRCPRCAGSFHCGMNDAAPCACAGVLLDAALQQRLRKRYTGCLCLRCLRSLAAGPAPGPSSLSKKDG